MIIAYLYLLHFKLRLSNSFHCYLPVVVYHPITNWLLSSWWDLVYFCASSKAKPERDARAYVYNVILYRPQNKQSYTSTYMNVIETLKNKKVIEYTLDDLICIKLKGAKLKKFMFRDNYMSGKLKKNKRWNLKSQDN